MKRNAALVLIVTVSSLAATFVSGQSLAAEAVYSWSVQTNTAAWNQALGVKYTRQGCPDAPTACLSFAKSLAQSENVKVTLAIPLNATSTAVDARQYSRLSLSAPFLAEVSIDDFVSQYRALSKDSSVQPVAVVTEVVSNLKSVNPGLAFGATIYEDDLANSLLQNANLPASLRAQFDYIHLFIHYREDGPNYATYVQNAKRLFPRAHIIAGSYAYDRRAFLPCTPGGTACTEQQDFDLFKESLTVQAKELKQGVVDRIEFFPGYFGTEATWSGWSNPRECAAGEVSECISNTIAMRNAALEILKGSSAPASWKQLSPSGTAPSARYGQSAAIDSASHRMIIFGGTSFSEALSDTWILTNADGLHGQPAWIPVVTAAAPPATSYSNGMYDSNSNRMMLFGGASGTDVWVLTNANGLGSAAPKWIQLNATAGVGDMPNVLTDYEKTVYDPVNNLMIVYDSTAGVWVLTHANGLGGTPVWSQLNVPSNGPSGRAAFTTVYDAAANRMIVFGGSAGGNDLDDLWVLANANGMDASLSEWIPLPTGTSTVPSGRSGHLAVYDPTSDAMSIFGGNGLPAETWTASHASGLTQPPVWTMTNSGVPAPDPRTSATAVLDTNSFSMIVFGGYGTELYNTVIVLTPVL